MRQESVVRSLETGGRGEGIGEQVNRRQNIGDSVERVGGRQSIIDSAYGGFATANHKNRRRVTGLFRFATEVTENTEIHNYNPCKSV
jgi:hypothetical protein